MFIFTVIIRLDDELDSSCDNYMGMFCLAQEDLFVLL